MPTAPALRRQPPTLALFQTIPWATSPNTQPPYTTPRNTIFCAWLFLQHEFFPMEREGAFSFCRPPPSRPLVLPPPPPPTQTNGFVIPFTWSITGWFWCWWLSTFFVPIWTKLTGELRERGWFSRMAGEGGSGLGRGVEGKISTKSCEPRGMTTNYSWKDPPPHTGFILRTYIHA